MLCRELLATNAWFVGLLVCASAECRTHRHSEPPALALSRDGSATGANGGASKTALGISSSPDSQTSTHSEANHRRRGRKPERRLLSKMMQPSRLPLKSQEPFIKVRRLCRGLLAKEACLSGFWFAPPLNAELLGTLSPQRWQHHWMGPPLGLATGPQKLLLECQALRTPQISNHLETNHRRRGCKPERPFLSKMLQPSSLPLKPRNPSSRSEGSACSAVSSLQQMLLVCASAECRTHRHSVPPALALSKDGSATGANGGASKTALRSEPSAPWTQA